MIDYAIRKAGIGAVREGGLFAACWQSAVGSQQSAVSSRQSAVGSRERVGFGFPIKENAPGGSIFFYRTFR